MLSSSSPGMAWSGTEDARLDSDIAFLRHEIRTTSPVPRGRNKSKGEVTRYFWHITYMLTLPSPPKLHYTSDTALYE